METRLRWAQGRAGTPPASHAPVPCPPTRTPTPTQPAAVSSVSPALATLHRMLRGQKRIERLPSVAGERRSEGPGRLGPEGETPGPRVRLLLRGEASAASSKTGWGRRGPGLGRRGPEVAAGARAEKPRRWESNEMPGW